MDLDPWIVFKAYGCRWEIEVVAKYYKSACEFDVTNVHDDYSVIGREFCNFLSTLLTFRLINRFDKVPILEELTYGNVMDVLARAKKIKIKGNWELIRLNIGQVEILQRLGLLPQTLGSESGAPARRGRPSKITI